MGITGCCNKSENRKYHQLPREFLAHTDFSHGLYKEIGVGPVHGGHPVGHPKPTRPLCLQAPPGAGTSSTQQAAIGAKSCARNARTKNAARRSADNIRTNRQLQRAWPMGGSPRCLSLKLA